MSGCAHDHECGDCRCGVDGHEERHAREDVDAFSRKDAWQRKTRYLD